MKGFSVTGKEVIECLTYDVPGMCGSPTKPALAPAFDEFVSWCAFFCFCLRFLSLTMDGEEVVAPAVPAMETIHNTLLEMRAMCDGHIFGMVSMINY